MAQPKVDEMERKEFLKQIVVGLDIYAKEHRITKEFEALFYTFVTRFMPKNSPWLHISDFIMAMSQPINQIRTFNCIKDPAIRQLMNNPIIYDGEIHEEYRAFIGDFTNPLESEEAYFLHILRFCQKNKDRKEFQDLYEQIRMDYFTLKPVLTDDEYQTFLDSLKPFDHTFNFQQGQGNLSDFVADFYRKESSKVLHVCHRCGYPMERKGTGFECLAKEICDEYEVTEHSFSTKPINTKKEDRWILKESFYRYITLPGRFEYHGYQQLVKKLGKTNVFLYPECEKDGDVQATLPNGQKLKIDFKDHRYPRYLLEKLKKDPKSTQMDYIVVPDHYYKNGYYKSEIDVINKNQTQYEILSLKKFLKTI